MGFTITITGPDFRLELDVSADQAKDLIDQLVEPVFEAASAIEADEPPEDALPDKPTGNKVGRPRKQNEDDKNVECKKCGSSNIIKHGVRYNDLEEKQRYQCKDCNYKFCVGEKRRKVSPEIEEKIIKLREEGLSFRKIESALAKENIFVKHTTIMSHCKDDSRIKKGAGRTGRPRVISQEDGIRILELAKKGLSTHENFEQMKKLGFKPAISTLQLFLQRNKRQLKGESDVTEQAVESESFPAIKLYEEPQEEDESGQSANEHRRTKEERDDFSKKHYGKDNEKMRRWQENDEDDKPEEEEES